MLENAHKNLVTSKKLSVKSYQGFTLIELIMVAIIIGTLAAFFINSYPASQGRARDTARRNDLKQYQTALEVFADRNNGFYPGSLAAVKPSTLCTILGYTATDCPDDPRDTLSSCNGGTCQYQYITNTEETEYGLWARLERPHDNSIPFYITCSNGRTNEGATAPTNLVVCPI